MDIDKSGAASPPTFPKITMDSNAICENDLPIPSNIVCLTPKTKTVTSLKKVIKKTNLKSNKKQKSTLSSVAKSKIINNNELLNENIQLKNNIQEQQVQFTILQGQMKEMQQYIQQLEEKISNISSTHQQHMQPNLHTNTAPTRREQIFSKPQNVTDNYQGYSKSFEQQRQTLAIAEIHANQSQQYQSPNEDGANLLPPSHGQSPQASSNVPQPRIQHNEKVQNHNTTTREQDGFVSSIPTANQFDIFDNEDEIICFDETANDLDMDQSHHTPVNQNQSHPPKTQHNAQRNDAPHAGNNHKTRGLKSKTAPPPINVCNSNINLIAKSLQKVNVNKGYSVKKTFDKHIIFTDNIDLFKTTKEALTLDKIENYSRTPIQERKKTYLLRGLDGNENPEDIRDDLNKLNISNVKIANVQKFVPLNKNRISFCSLFQVQITPESDENQLFKVKSVNNIIIRWENVKQTQIAQCYRCQRMGHMASNCSMIYRCVKCKQEPYHLPGECSLIKNQTLKFNELYCVECKEYGHPASYRGCPKIKNYIKNSKKNIPPKDILPSPHIVHGRSFATVVNPTPTSHNGPPPVNDFESLKNCLLSNFDIKFNLLHTELRNQISRIDYLYGSSSHLQ